MATEQSFSVHDIRATLRQMLPQHADNIADDRDGIESDAPDANNNDTGLHFFLNTPATPMSGYTGFGGFNGGYTGALRTYGSGPEWNGSNGGQLDPKVTQAILDQATITGNKIYFAYDTASRTAKLIIPGYGAFNTGSGNSDGFLNQDMAHVKKTGMLPNGSYKVTYDGNHPNLHGPAFALDPLFDTNRTELFLHTGSNLKSLGCAKLSPEDLEKVIPILQAMSANGSIIMEVDTAQNIEATLKSQNEMVAAAKARQQEALAAKQAATSQQVATTLPATPQTAPVPVAM